MRKVIFKEWIPAIYKDENGTKTLQEGTNCWQSEFNHIGVFHQWGCSYDEFENGAGNYTVAIVETAKGEIKEVLPCNIKFV